MITIMGFLQWGVNYESCRICSLPPSPSPPLAWPTESPKHQGTTSGLLWPVSYIEENGLSRGSFAPEAAALLERTHIQISVGRPEALLKGFKVTVPNQAPSHEGRYIKSKKNKECKIQVKERTKCVFCFVLKRNCLHQRENHYFIFVSSKKNCMLIFYLIDLTYFYIALLSFPDLQLL